MPFSSPAAKTVAAVKSVPAGAGADVTGWKVKSATDRVSEESRRWLASCGLTVEQMQNQMGPLYTPARRYPLYHCDSSRTAGAYQHGRATEWCAEYDEWGNRLLNEENPHQLQQLIRLPVSSMMRVGHLTTATALL